MAAPTIKLRRSATANSVPTTTQLALGEVAINTYDGKVFIKKNVDGTESIVDVGANAETVSLTATNSASGFHYITFVDATTGDENLRTDTSLRYVPSTGEFNIPNVTATSATLGSISASGDATITGSLTAGGLSYPTTNGTSGYVLTSDGSGNVTWSSVTASEATLAQNIDVHENNNTNESVYLVFVDGSTGSQRPEVDTGLTYNPSTNVLSTTASVASTVDLGNTASDDTCFLTFVRDSGGDRQIFTNSNNLLYDSVTNTISANLTGTASNATDADKVDLGNNATDTTCFPLFVRDTTGTQQIFTNSANYTYDASTNTISANTSGIAANATKAELVYLGNNATDSSCFLTFVRATSGAQRINTNSSNLLYDASTNTISANLTGTASVASTVDLGNTASDTTCFLTFVKDSGGDRQIFTNSSSLLYNASTNKISANLAGTADIASVASTVDLGNNASDTTCFPVFVRTATGDEQIFTNSANYTYNASTNTLSANTSGNAATASALATNATGTNLTLSGNLTVNGTTVTLNTTTLDVSDLNITVASGAADSAAADGAGLTVDGASATFNYSHSGTKWVSNKDIEAEAFIKNGGTSSQFLKADGSVDSSTYLTSYTETNDLSSAVTWANVPDANITESSVTQHQAALSITESQISDLQTYLTSYTETNDLSSAVTWANVPNANITESSVTQHQAALSITESQISDLQTYLTSYTETDPVVAAINGIVKSNGTTISAAVAGTDYLTPTGDGSGLSGISSDVVNDTTPQLGGDLNTNSNVIEFPDSSGEMVNRAHFGDGRDLQIYHDGSSSYIDNSTGNLLTRVPAGNLFAIQQTGGTENIALFNADGACELYHNNVQTLITTISGVTVTGALTATSIVKSGGTSSQFLMADGSVSTGGGGGISNVVEDTTPQLGGTLDTNGNLIQFGDSSSATDDRLQFGASQDLQIYHDAAGATNQITTATGQDLKIFTQGTGQVWIQSDTPTLVFDDVTGGIQDNMSMSWNGSVFTMSETTNSDTLFTATKDGSVDLYHNNSKKLETTTSGATVTGTLTATADVTVKGAVRCENSASTERFEILYNETDDSLDFVYNAS